MSACIFADCLGGGFMLVFSLSVCKASSVSVRGEASSKVDFAV